MDRSRQDPFPAKLAKERLRRHWSQEQLAAHLETTPGNVSRWERGVTTPSPYFRHRLTELLHLSEEELGLPLAVPETAAKNGTGELGARIATLISRARPRFEVAGNPAGPRRRRLLLTLGAIVLLCAVLVAGPIAYSRLTHTRTGVPHPLPLWRDWALRNTDAFRDAELWPGFPYDGRSGCGLISGPAAVSPIYQMQSKGLNECPYSDSDHHPWTDMALSLEVDIEEGEWGGPIVHLRQGNYYYYNITTDGRYDLRRHLTDAGGQDATIAGGAAGAIKRGRHVWNTLAIAVRDSTFQLWINGQYIATARDDVRPWGTIGVATNQGSDTNATVTRVQFRHARVWLPTGESYEVG